MRLLIHDFAGHPFPTELSRQLAKRGHVVTHAYCGGVTTGRGLLRALPDDPADLRFVDVDDAPFERYSPVGRLKSEITYGRKAAALVTSVRPAAVVSANTPLGAQHQIWRAASKVGARRVFWLQDFLGRGTRSVLRARSPLLGATFGQVWEALETRLLRQSDMIVGITDDFLPELERRRARVPVRVIENWAPLLEMTLRPKSNPWSRAHGLADRPVALYAGTLGLKHDPEHLVAAAKKLEGSGGVVVVVTEGLGRDHLEARKIERGINSLRLLDFVDYEVFPDLLGTADVCLVLLEPDAGAFSAPSKVLAYLTAGRATVGAMPAENLATRTVERAGAGIVIDPGNHAAFANVVAALLADGTRAAEMGAAGRRYAEATFDIERITDEFESVLTHQ